MCDRDVCVCVCVCVCVTSFDHVRLLCVALPGWNELLIAGFSHRSIASHDGILLGGGLEVTRHTAHQVGMGSIFDRVLTELVAKMREMKMDKSELGCLRAIVLFNPGQSVLTYCAFPLLTRGALACCHR